MRFFQGKVFRVWLLIGLAFFLAEEILRIRDMQRFGQTKSSMIIDDPVDGRSLVPNYKVEGALRTITINEYGFRGASFAKDVPAGTLRIACLGSSTVFCAVSNSDHETLPAVIEKELSNEINHEQLANHVEVINAGIPGLSTKTLQQHFEKRVVPFKPQLAIIYPPPNDAGVVFRANNQAGHSGPPSHFLRKWRTENSVMYRTLRDEVKPYSPNVAANQFKKFPADAEAAFAADYKNLIESCRKNHVIPVLVQPSFAFRRDQSNAEQHKMFSTGFFDIDIASAFDAVDAMQSACRKVAAEENVPIIDAEFAVPASQENFEDAMHLTPKGNAIMGAYIARELIRLGVIDQIF